MIDLDRIQELMDEKYMSSRQVDLKAGLGVGVTKRLLRTGKGSFTTIKKIARALEVEPIELIKGEKGKKK
ncbi:MAG TPA: helix-turn-helix domain-containing protein [Clostridiaceae bacterium]|nr:helix-turn-helix domain-containing protein [Clostridiaceae bacterium]